PSAAANQGRARQAPPNPATPPPPPTDDVSPPPLAADPRPEPWDWSLEEAWLRAPDDEWLEAFGAEPECWGAELEDEEAEPLYANEFNDGDEGSERWRPSPDASWSKLTLRRGRGLARPGAGSLCRVRVGPARHGGAAWGAPAAPSGWRSVRLGSAEGRWSWALDAILETMTAGEVAALRPAGAAGASIAVRLGLFTPAPPFWATPAPVRWRSVLRGRSRADALLGLGLDAAAGRAFSRALRAAAAAGAPPDAPELGGVKAELHAGLALAQLRLGLPAAAAANAGKALALRPAHLEARYRRGVAQAAMMDLEAAGQDLVAVLRVQPGHAGARRELRRVRSAARERDARLARRLGRLFA
ncbi:PREDICTED: FK506-binding protein-like, partial [Pseudopodoces humilis]|uniref:FK506-binding protein-like n=1 Tax=Pseudopodoces humilis TaxID=181119 RepID=UPI000395A9B0